MKISRNSRKTTGAIMGLIIACTTFFVMLVVVFFYFAGVISSDRQLVSSADAGALAATQQLLTVTLTPAQVAQLPQEFTGLGVDANGNICPSGKDSNGNPALFNLIAYNNCAAYALEIALNAAADGSQNAISSANTVITAANTFAAQLTTLIQNSTNPATAASTLMANNPLINLPAKLFGLNNGDNLTPNSLQLAYYTGPGATSNVYLPAAYTTALAAKTQQATNWINQTVSNMPSANNGPNYLLGGTPLIINTITNSKGFVDAKGNPLALALVPSQPNELCHLISTRQYYSTSVPNTNATISTYSLPFNAVALQGQSMGQDCSTRLSALSAAVANLAPYPAYIPKNVAYIAIVNGGDYNAAMNNGGLSALQVQQMGYSNIDLNASTNIAFDHSQTNIFDLLEVINCQSAYPMPGTPPGCGLCPMPSNMVIAGVDSNLGICSKITNPVVGQPNSYAPGLAAAYIFEASGTYPATNYNNVVDSPSPSIPFVLAIDPQGFAAAPYNNLHESTFAAVAAWAVYNQSQGTALGTDTLNRNPNLDPLGPGGSPALNAKGPNSVVTGGIAQETSTAGQIMTIATALKIQDAVLIQGGQQFFGRVQPSWVYNLIQVIASNYGYPYLPKPIGEYRPNGFTALEWIKAQITCLNGGCGLSESFPVVPCGILPAILEGNFNAAGTENTNSPYSGLRYFDPIDSSGNYPHYAWPEPSGCPQFETPGTPWMLLRNINCFETDNQGQFNPNEPIWSGLMNKLLAALQQMNPNITMNDLTTVLNGATLDLSQTLFLIYDSTQPLNDGLEMVNTLPAGVTYVPLVDTGPGVPPGGAKAIGYPPSFGSDLGITGYTVNTTASPNSTVVSPFTGQSYAPGTYADSFTTSILPEQFSHGGPYSYFDGGPFNPSGSMPWDYGYFIPGTGAGNNHGEIHFREYLDTGSDNGTNFMEARNPLW